MAAHATHRKPQALGRWCKSVASIVIAMLALLAHPAAADLTARLSASKIDETQTLELIIRTESRDVQGMPDLKPIESDFEVLTTRTSSQYRAINGKVQTWTEWIIALRPLRTGTLRIPPLSYRNETTKALSLQVVPLDPALKEQMSNRVFFETSVEPENPYVQAQTIYTRRLLYADGTQIYGEMPDTPSIEDAVVVVLGNATSSTVERSGNRYGMIEQRYAIFPERSGTLEIPGAMVSGSVRMRVNNRLRRNGVRVIAEPVTLKVRPIPERYPKGTPWLPASDVTLLTAWDNDPPTFKRGESVRQTLIVRADAATGSLIPPIEYSIPQQHFRAYPEQPDIADNRAASGVVGTRSQSWSMIPTVDGPATLPAVNLTWFNTTTERVETSTLPPRELRVFGPVDDPSTVQSPAVSNTEPETVTASDESATPTTVDVSERRVFGPWMIAILVLGIGVASWFGRNRLSNLGITRKLWPQFLRLRAIRAEFVELLAEGSARDIRSRLAKVTEQHARAGKPVNADALAQLYATLDAASYAPVSRDPDRELASCQALTHQLIHIGRQTFCCQHLLKRCAHLQLSVTGVALPLGERACQARCDLWIRGV